ncbi:MAG TPA: 23S rRNA (guanosine(2251)-2'-O)-methyltransferase RlmB [Blastocatellia bacterium]
MTYIRGIGPVVEAMKAGSRHIERVIVVEGPNHGRLAEIINQARALGIQVRREPRAALDRLAGGANHQGVLAVTSTVGYADADDLLARTGPDTFLVLLDGIEDPHNLGAIIRTAECAGATAVVIPERRSAHVTETVVKTSAGATEHLPIARVTNLATFVDALKRRGFWIAGIDPGGKTNYTEYDYTGPLALIFGAEGHGLHRLVRDKCDVTLSVPMQGKIGSLNVSVTVGVVLFEAIRRRGINPAPA